MGLGDAIGNAGRQAGAVLNPPPAPPAPVTDPNTDTAAPPPAPSPAAPPASVVTQDAYNLAVNSYPQYAWMLNVPELHDLLTSAAQDGTPAPQLLAKLEATNWWKARSSSTRAWDQLYATDPAEAQRRVEAQKAAITQVMSQRYGASLADAQLTATAYASLMNGWTDQQIVDHLSQAVTVDNAGHLGLRPYVMDPKTGLESDVLSGRRAYYGPDNQPATPDEQQAKQTWGDGNYKTFQQADGTTVFYGDSKAINGAAINDQRGGTATGQGDYGAQVAALKKIASDYLIPISDQTLGQAALDILAGKSDVQAFTADLQQQASHLWGPQVADSIARGRTVAQVVEPYRQQAASLLGINAESVNFMDPKWQKALANQDPKTGNVAMMTLPQWQQTLMSDPTYGYANSRNAQDRASAMVNAIGQAFGKSTGGSGFGGTAPLSVG